MLADAITTDTLLVVLLVLLIAAVAVWIIRAIR